VTEEKRKKWWLGDKRETTPEERGRIGEKGEGELLQKKTGKGKRTTHRRTV